MRWLLICEQSRSKKLTNEKESPNKARTAERELRFGQNKLAEKTLEVVAPGKDEEEEDDEEV